MHYLLEATLRCIDGAALSAKKTFRELLLLGAMLSLWTLEAHLSVH